MERLHSVVGGASSVNFANSPVKVYQSWLPVVAPVYRLPAMGITLIVITVIVTCTLCLC